MRVEHFYGCRTESAVSSWIRYGFVAHLSEGGVGTISEIFDAEAPHIPRGCVAQAWSVAEVLRCWLKTAPAAPDSSN